MGYFWIFRCGGECSGCGL